MPSGASPQDWRRTFYARKSPATAKAARQARSAVSVVPQKFIAESPMNLLTIQASVPTSAVSTPLPAAQLTSTTVPF